MYNNVDFNIIPTSFLPLTKKSILTKTTENDIFHHVVGTNTLFPYQKFCNPLRLDNHPNCWLEFYNNRLRLVDFADNRFHNIDCFDAVMFKHNLNYNDALKLINVKLNLGLSGIKTKKAAIRSKNLQKLNLDITSREQVINFSSRTFDVRDESFWKPLTVTSTQLKEDGIFPVLFYEFNTKKNPKELYCIRPKDVTYAIVEESGNKKIYRPFSPTKQGKWMANVKASDVGFKNHKQTSDTLIITKSYKDARILRNISDNPNNDLKFDVRYVQGEGMKLPFNYILDFDKDYTEIYNLFDNLPGGIKQGFNFAEHCNEVLAKIKFKNIHYPIHLPEDTADITREYGIGRTIFELKQLIK